MSHPQESRGKEAARISKKPSARHASKHSKALVHPPSSEDLKKLLDKYSGPGPAAATVAKNDMVKIVNTLHFDKQFEHCKEELGEIEPFTDKINKHHLVGYVQIGPFRFIFFRPATCVRWPNDADPDTLPPYLLGIYRDGPYQKELRRRARAGEVRFDTGADGKALGLEPGLFIDKDGKVTVMRPPAKYDLELVVPGNPGDVPLNYKC